MSDFVRQNGSSCDFGTSDSWVILSPIELSIKRKIEAAGTPLKDWDINIYRGVLTGCNEAFIINREKRDEILQNCETDDERERTAELIRPILRGRDIKRYGYVENGLFLINTHNGLKDKGIPPIDVNEYPAIKAHLDKYWDKISVRADKGVTPYNLRNCAYLEDFDKPKIVWPRLMRINKNDLSSFPRFAKVEKEVYVVDSLCFFIGNNIDVLCDVLNSDYAAYYFFRNIAILDNGGMQMRQQYVENIPIPPNLSKFHEGEEQSIYEMLGLTNTEIDFIKDYLKKQMDDISSSESR